MYLCSITYVGSQLSRSYLVVDTWLRTSEPDELMALWCVERNLRDHCCCDSHFPPVLRTRHPARRLVKRQCLGDLQERRDSQSSELPSSVRHLHAYSVNCRAYVVTCQIHLETYNIIHLNQHGLSAKDCPLHETQLISTSTLQVWTLCADHKRQTDVVLLDFSKAFDKVSHRKLQFPHRPIHLFADNSGNKLLANMYTIPYRSPTTHTTQNLSDHDFDLSRSLKVKSDSCD